MIAADDVAIAAPAFGELGGTVAAAVAQRRRLAVAVEDSMMFSPKSVKGFGPSSACGSAGSRTRIAAELFVSCTAWNFPWVVSVLMPLNAGGGAAF